MTIIIIAVIIIFIIFIITRRRKRRRYEEITGDAYDDVVVDIIKDKRQKIKKRKANIEDKYVLADVLANNVAPNIRGTNHPNIAADRLFRETLNDMMNEDMVVRQILTHDDAPNMETMIDRIETRIPDVAPRAEQARRKVRNIKASRIAQKQYFTKQPIRNDPQNVHDREVNSKLSQKYHSLKELNSHNGGSDSLKQLEAIIAKKGNDKALSALHLMCNGGQITSLNASEADVLRNVWARVNSPDNRDNRDNLIDSLVSSLENIYENDKPVCTTGRCYRVLDSLTLLDAAEAVGKPVKTADILRSEILSKSYKILQDELAATDETTRDAYNGKRPGDTSAFEELVKSKIEAISSDYTDVDTKVLDNIIEDAKAGI